MVDLYDNLENYEDVGAEAKLLSENEAIKIKLSESQAAYNALKKDFDKLYGQYEQLSLNFSSLLKTARAEIERKTNAISQLNIEKDHLMIQSLKDRTNKAHLGRHNERSWSKPKQIEFPNEQINKCRDKNERLSDDSKKVQDYPESQGSLEQILLCDPRQKLLGSQETDQDINVSPGQGKENDNSHLKLRPGRIADRRKSMPVLRQQPKFSTEEEDDDVNSTGSHNYLPPIDEVDEGMKRVTDERLMKSGESSIQQNMQQEKNIHERDRVTRSRHEVEIDARNKPRGRERERFEGNYKSKRRGGEKFRRSRNPCHNEEYDRSRSPPYDKYQRSKSRDRRYHYDKREPVFEYDRQTQTYHDSHHAKHNLYNNDEEPPYKRRKTERSIGEVKRNEHIRGRSRETLTESSKSSRQSSLLRHDERNIKHIEEFPNKKEVLNTKLIMGQSNEILLAQYSQDPRHPLSLPREEKTHSHIDKDNVDVMHIKQTQSQSKKVSGNSSQSPSQTSLLHEDKTHKHFKEDHRNKSYEVKLNKQTRGSHSSTQFSSLLAENRSPINIENKHYEVDNEARQTKQIRDILAAESQQSSRKSSLWPESKAHGEIEINECKKHDDNRRKKYPVHQIEKDAPCSTTKDNTPTFKAAAGKSAIDENPVNEINMNVERPPRSMSVESGEIDDTDEYSPTSAAYSMNSIPIVPKKAPTIERRMSPRKSVYTKSYKKPEKKQRQISGKINDLTKKKEDIKIANKIIRIEDQPDPSCITTKYKIPKKNKYMFKEDLFPSVVTPKPEDHLSKHLKAHNSKKDQIDSKSSAESTETVTSKISKSGSSKKINEEMKEETLKHHKKMSPSPASPSSCPKDLPSKGHTNVKYKASSDTNTDSSTISPVAQSSSKKSDESRQKSKDVTIDGRRKIKDKVKKSESEDRIVTVGQLKSRDAIKTNYRSNRDCENTESMFTDLTSKAVVEGDLQLSDESTDSIDIYGGIIQDNVAVPEKKDSKSITQAHPRNEGVEQQTDKFDSKGDDSKSKDINAKLCELFGDSSSLVTLEDLIPTQNTEGQGYAYMPSPSQAALMAQNEFWDRENATEHNDDHTKMQTRSTTRQRKGSGEKKSHKKNLNTGVALKAVSNDNRLESKEKDIEIIVSEKLSKQVDIDLPCLIDEINRKEFPPISSPTTDLPVLPVADIPLENIGTVEVPLSIHVPSQSSNEGDNEVRGRVIPPSDEAYEKDVYKTIVISTGTQPQCVKETVPVGIEDAGCKTRTEDADAPVVAKEPGPMCRSLASLMESLATSTPVQPQKATEITEPMHKHLPVLVSIADTPNITDKTEESIPQNSSNCSQNKTGGDVDVRIVMKRKRRFIR